MLKKAFYYGLGSLMTTMTVGSTFAATWSQDGFGGQNTDSNPNVPGASDGLQEGKLLDVVKNFVNWILGLLGLVALIVLLWGGFQMITAAGNDEKYKKGFTILKQAAFGLIFIGMSWMIVSIIFWVISGTTS